MKTEAEKAYQRGWYAKNRKRIREQAREWRLKNLERARGYQNRYRKNHPDKIREKDRRLRAAKRAIKPPRKTTTPEERREKDRRRSSEYYYRNRDRCLAQVKAHRSDPEVAARRKTYVLAYRERNRKKIRESKRQYARANPELVRQQRRESWGRHKEKCYAKRRRYYREHRAEIREWARRHHQKKKHDPTYAAKRLAAVEVRRARKQRATIEAEVPDCRAFTLKIRTAEKARCYWCGKRVPKGDRHIDHIIPLSKGGKHSVHNLCCSCGFCNTSKGAKLPQDFCGQQEIVFA